MYSYYAFAVQNWCNASNFQIHGLWPQFNSTTYPSWCAMKPYEQVSGPLLTEMTANWNADCNSTVGQSFWQHEWAKHGTCFSVQTGATEEQYFTAALQLWNSLANETSSWSQSCAEGDACIVACFDLNMNEISC